MYRTLLFLLVLLVSCVTVKPQTPARFSSYYDGKRYDFRVTEEQLKATPAWPQDQDAPPLLPRTALGNARKYLQGLFPEAEEWKPSRITLFPMWNSWVYLIDFAERPPINASNNPPPPFFTIVVLMNGEAVQPKIIELKLPKKP